MSWFVGAVVGWRWKLLSVALRQRNVPLHSSSLVVCSGADIVEVTARSFGSRVGLFFRVAVSPVGGWSISTYLFRVEHRLWHRGRTLLVPT